MESDDESTIQSNVNVVTRDSSAIHSSRIKISFDSNKIEEDGNKYIVDFYKIALNEPTNLTNKDHLNQPSNIIKDDAIEDDENTIQSKVKVVTRDSSAIRSTRIKIKRRPAIFFDASKNEENGNKCLKDFYRITSNEPTNNAHSDERSSNIENETVEENSYAVLRNPRRNSFDDAIEAEIKDLDESCDYCDSEHEIDEPNETIPMEVSIKTKNVRRSESTENLLSSLIINNNAKTNYIMNIKMLLNHESHHLCLLTSIQQYKYILEQSKVSSDIVWKIFYNISDLIYAQKSLVTYLESMLTDFDGQQSHFDEVMDLYTLLHLKCKEYVKNIPRANQELKILFEKHPNFKSAIYEVTYEGKTLFIDVLIAKPVNWLCNSLELIKNLIDTADGEEDVRKLEETLENLKKNADGRSSNKNTLEKNNFLRSSLFVELLPADVRKLRHVFLFSGMVVCAKQKLQSECNHSMKIPHGDHEEKGSISKSLLETKSIEKFDVKWYISLNNLVFHLSKTSECNDRKKNDIAALKDKIRELKLQLSSEQSKLSSDNFASKKTKIKKDIDRLCNNIFKIQTDLLLISPTVEFLISNGPEKPHTLLLPSVKDLEIWKCEILKVQREQKLNDFSNMSITAVNNHLESYRTFRKIIDVANSPLLHDDGKSGVVITTIHKVEGLNPDFRYYLSIEVDSFNLNELKARTKLCTGRSLLVWNESFDIDLDCGQTINILVYEIKNYGENKESLIGYFDFQCKSLDFQNKKITKIVPMLSNESAKLTLEASFKYEAKNELLKRQPSIMVTGLFGINLRSIVSREKKGNVDVENVPMIIVKCVKRIEENGLNEEGIYRISGSKNEINDFYKRLNKNTVNALNNMGAYDLHTITGIVKMYFRELPEPLMMSNNYEHLLIIAKMEDEFDRHKSYEEIINNLPEPNHTTLVFILKHFQKVVEHSDKNQMIAGNLGLILGPTLILPPCNTDKQGLNNIALETMTSFLLARAFTQILIGVCKGNIKLDRIN